MRLKKEISLKEKSYKSLLKTANVFQIRNSELFNFLNGNDSNFDSMGQKESKLKFYEIEMLSKLSKISHKLEFDIPSYYVTKDFMVDIPVSTK